ncbi:protein of unknown function [Nitrospira defluvii]|uniref:Uncharacterized protein n=1 Tax=Nitrospira defluvii TaxID=330214 RepID=D8PF92_9BACT|nr:protein of unknown function [Nitrospira defluvii]
MALNDQSLGFDPGRHSTTDTSDIFTGRRYISFIHVNLASDERAQALSYNDVSDRQNITSNNDSTLCCPLRIRRGRCHTKLHQQCRD